MLFIFDLNVDINTVLFLLTVIVPQILMVML